MKRIFTLIFLLVVICNTNSYSQWRDEADGLQSQPSNCIARSGDYYILGTRDKGIYFCRNDSIYWTQNNDALNNQAILCLAADGNSVYAGTKNGVYLSTEIGNNMAFKKVGLPSSKINSLAIKGDSVFAGTDAGLYITEDEGYSWKICTNEFYTKIVNTILVSDTSIFVGTSGGGLYISHDNGGTWIKKDLGLKDENILSIYKNGLNVYVGIQFAQPNYFGGMYLSTDNGDTWVRKINDISYKSIFSFAVIDNRIFAATEKNGVYVSTNNCKSWDEFYDKLPSAYTNTLFVDGNIIIVGTLSGVAMIKEADSKWLPINIGLKRITINSLQFFDQQMVAITDRGVSISYDERYNWKEIFYEDVYNVCAVAAKDNLIFVSLGGYMFYESKDGGKKWDFVDENNKFDHITALSVRGNKLLGVSNEKGFLISSDNALSWIIRNSGLKHWGVNEILNYENYLYLATEGGVYYSSDDGENWLFKSNGLTYEHITSIAVYENNLYAGTHNGVFVSTNGGENWSLKSYGLTNLQINSIIAGENYVFAGTDAGVFLSTNKCDSWISKNSGLANLNIFSLCEKNKTIFAGNRNSMYRAELSDFGIVDVKETPPTNNLDFNISPNPATENIRVSLQDDLQNAVIKITSAQGILFYENSYASITKELPVEISTKYLPIGVYLCTINSASYIATKKFLVIK